MQSVSIVISAINELELGDTLYLHIDSPGGEVNAGDKLMDVMKRSRGTIVAVLDGQTASKAVDIALTAHKVIMGDSRGETVIHEAYVIAGLFRLHNIDERTNSIEQRQIKLYHHIITEKEERKVFLDHEDLRMTNEQFIHRINHHVR